MSHTPAPLYIAVGVRTIAAMNTTERAERNAQIVELRLRGLTQRQVATAMGVAPSTVAEVMAEYRESPASKTLRESDAIEVVDTMLRGYQADLEELALVANSAATNPAVRVGAINSRMGARDRIITLLQATGVLPHDLGKLRDEMDVRFIAERLTSIMEKYDMPEEAYDEVLAALGEGSTAATVA